jgi:hypothetical protein
MGHQITENDSRPPAGPGRRSLLPGTYCGCHSIDGPGKSVARCSALTLGFEQLRFSFITIRPTPKRWQPNCFQSYARICEVTIPKFPCKVCSRRSAKSETRVLCRKQKSVCTIAINSCGMWPGKCCGRSRLTKCRQSMSDEPAGTKTDSKGLIL